MSTRPEHVAPPDIFYDETEARKYASNSRMMTIQTRMTERAIELLSLPKGKPAYILDIGCGSGLSGETLTEAGHYWVGVDISPAMLAVALEREVEGDVLLADAGQGMFFRPGSFDAAVSISALQWLCNADKREHVPQKRLKVFFASLYRSLARGARAVLQIYPETPAQMTMITTAAMRCGFSGGLVVDYPNSTKARKYFLCLFAGSPNVNIDLPKALESSGEVDDDHGEDEEKLPIRNTVLFTSATKEKASRKSTGRQGVKHRDWVLAKKDRRRRQGKATAPDSKYAGRRRPVGF